MLNLVKHLYRQRSAQRDHGQFWKAVKCNRAAASSPPSEDCLPSQRVCREGAVKAAMEFLYMISNSLHFSIESDSCLHLLHLLYVIINVFYVRGYHIIQY